MNNDHLPTKQPHFWNPEGDRCTQDLLYINEDLKTNIFMFDYSKLFNHLTISLQFNKTFFAFLGVIVLAWPAPFVWPQFDARQVNIY